MNVDTKPDVISEVPTWIVRVFINDDRIGGPDPIGHVGEIDWGYAPIPVVEPKPVRAATGQAPLVPGTETAAEAAVLPRVVKVKTRVMRFMAYPTARTGVYVRRVRMSRLIAKIGMFRWRRLTTLIRLWFGTARSGCATRSRRRAMCRDIPMTHFVSARRAALWGMSFGMFFGVLGKHCAALKKKRNCESQ